MKVKRTRHSTLVSNDASCICLNGQHYEQHWAYLLDNKLFFFFLLFTVILTIGIFDSWAIIVLISKGVQIPPCMQASSCDIKDLIWFRMQIMQLLCMPWIIPADPALRHHAMFMIALRCNEVTLKGNARVAKEERMKMCGRELIRSVFCRLRDDHEQFSILPDGSCFLLFPISDFIHILVINSFHVRL
jgi:hypothetical protein